MDFIPFNSRDTFYKSKFGAVKNRRKNFVSGLFLPRSFFRHGGLLLCCGATTVNFCEHKMCWAGMNGDDKEIWDIELSVPECGLYWYHFDYDSSWGRGSVYNIGDGKGDVWNGRNSRLQWQLTVYDEKLQNAVMAQGRNYVSDIAPTEFFSFGREERKRTVRQNFARRFRRRTELATERKGRGAQ